MKLIGYLIIAILISVLLKIIGLLTWSWLWVMLAPYIIVLSFYAVPLIYLIIRKDKKNE